MKRYLTALLAAIAVIMASVAFVAPAAHADASNTTSSSASPADSSPATADSSTPGLHKATASEDGDVVITATVKGTAIAKATAKSLSKATGSAYSFAAAQVRAVAKYSKSGCIWSTGTNSYYSSGVLHPYFDAVAMHLCPLKHPVTIGGITWHYIKVGGGTSGTACGNYANASNAPPPGIKTLLVLDVKAGTIARVAVYSRVCVEVTVEVNVTLEWTYEGETQTKTKTETATDRACKSAKDYSHKRITKHTTRRASAGAVAKAMAMVRARATATAKTRATAKAKAKAVAQVSVTIVIPAAPTASGQAHACVGSGQQTGVITASGTNNSSQAAPGTLTVGGQSHSFTSVGAGETVSWDFSGFAPGDYQGSFTLGSPVNRSASFTVHVAECPSADVSLDVLNDVGLTNPNCDGTRDECESYLISTAHATVPTGVSGTLRISSDIGTVGFSMGTPSDWRDDVSTMHLTTGQYDPQYRFNAPTEGTEATITLAFTPDGGGQIVTVSRTVQLNPAS